MAERLIRTSEAATLLGVSTRSIYRMARAGVLRRVRVRYGGPRYRLSEVRALMEADGFQAASAAPRSERG